MNRLLVSLVLALSAAVVSAASLTARDGWIRPAPPVAKVRAGYVVIENASEAEVVLTKAESPDFGAIEIHTMYDDAGTMRMRRVPELRVPAKGKVELKPGGLHLMLFGLREAVAEGGHIPVTLTFETAGSIAIEALVGPPGDLPAEHDGAAPADHSGHGAPAAAD